MNNYHPTNVWHNKNPNRLDGFTTSQLYPTPGKCFSVMIRLQTFILGSKIFDSVRQINSSKREIDGVKLREKRNGSHDLLLTSCLTDSKIPLALLNVLSLVANHVGVENNTRTKHHYCEYT
jgi:hypothetical protein